MNIHEWLWFQEEQEAAQSRFEEQEAKRLKAELRIKALKKEYESLPKIHQQMFLDDELTPAKSRMIAKRMAHIEVQIHKSLERRNK